MKLVCFLFFAACLTLLADINEINGIATSTLSEINGVAKSGISAVAGIDIAVDDVTPHVADANARLSLVGISPGYQVVQDDSGDTYQYNAPSTALNACFIGGAGTAETNGIYTKRGTYSGKDYYNLLGQGDSVTFSCVFWSETIWVIRDSGGGVLYTTTEDVTYPWEVTTWDRVDGSNPLPEAVSVTQGELDAGVSASGAGNTPSNAIYVITPAVSEGRWIYEQLLNPGDRVIKRDANKWIFNGSEIFYLSLEDTAFPWTVTTWTEVDGDPPVPTVTRNDIASEKNWQNLGPL